MTRWTSWHLHLASMEGEHLNRAVLDVVAPVAAGPWFFVRHWLYGPHIRLRMRDASDGITEQLTARLAAVLAGTPRLTDAQYQAAVAPFAAIGEGTGPMPTDRVREPGVYPETYEPEYGKYGGPEVMELSESLFHHASLLSVALLRAFADPAQAALSVLLTGIGALPANQRATFVSKAKSHWQPFLGDVEFAVSTEDMVAGLVERPQPLLDQMRSPRGALGGYAAALRDAVPMWPTPEGVLLSHLHMFCNRLGVGPAVEARLWAVLHEFLTRLHEGVAA